MPTALNVQHQVFVYHVTPVSAVTVKRSVTIDSKGLGNLFNGEDVNTPDSQSLPPATS